MYKKIVKAILSCIILGMLTGCSDGSALTQEFSKTEVIESNIETNNIDANAYLDSITDGSNLIVGEKYLIKDVQRDHNYIIRLYLEKGENRFLIRINVNNADVSFTFESGYSPVTLCAFYPGDYIKYLGDGRFEWIPVYTETKNDSE